MATAALLPAKAKVSAQLPLLRPTIDGAAAHKEDFDRQCLRLAQTIAKGCGERVSGRWKNANNL
jgi:hypothetical protein